MAIPVYLELYDDQSCKVEGGCNIQGREGTVEIIAYDHLISLPTDSHNGQVTGTRRHEPFRLVKVIDKTSPYLYKACCRGQTYNKAVLRHYLINDQGSEQEYFRIELEDVKITGIGPSMLNVKLPDADRLPHLEALALRYAKAKWMYLDGGIEYTDSWNDGKG